MHFLMHRLQQSRLGIIWLNNLTSVVYYFLGVSCNISSFFGSCGWLFMIHNRLRAGTVFIPTDI